MDIFVGDLNLIWYFFFLLELCRCLIFCLVFIVPDESSTVILLIKPYSERLVFFSVLGPFLVTLLVDFLSYMWRFCCNIHIIIPQYTCLYQGPPKHPSVFNVLPEIVEYFCIRYAHPPIYLNHSENIYSDFEMLHIELL